MPEYPGIQYRRDHANQPGAVRPDLGRGDFGAADGPAMTKQSQDFRLRHAPAAHVRDEAKEGCSQTFY